MKRKVIEAFDYAADGVHVNRLKVGRFYDFPVDHADRFEREGKLEPIGGMVPVVEPAAIPAVDAVASASVVADEPIATEAREPFRGRPKFK